MPPGFMRGAPHRVATNLSQCAERIYVRLGMWRVEEGARSKSPMPPAISVAVGDGDWHSGNEYRQLLDYVTGVLAARRGARPDLEALIEGGYENLPDCLPATG